MSKHEAAFKAWRDSIGEDNVIDGGVSLARWSAATQPWQAGAVGVIRPANAEEAAACLAIATEHHCPVYPISRGRGWGIGSRLPVNDAVMVDLSRLNRIDDIDMEHGSVRIGPGVTFNQLDAQLRDRGLRFHIPGFGGPAEASVLANALERGEGVGVQGDRFAGLWDLDVALASGERIRTGHGRFGNGAVVPVHGRPAGPLLEGLFSQTGWGVVVSGRVSLSYHGRHAYMVQIECGVAEDLEEPLRRLRHLVHNEVVAPYAIAIWDKLKQLMSMPDHRAEAMGSYRRAKASHWAAALTVSGDYLPLVEAKVDAIKEAFTGTAYKISIIADQDETGNRVRSILNGAPSNRNVSSCYACKSELPAPSELNPDLDDCGYLWLCPALPFTGEAIADMTGFARQCSIRHDIVIMLGAQAVSPRALHGYVSLAWDRNQAGADERALACHDELFGLLNERGYFPYRLAHASLARNARPQGDWGPVAARLRRALDPQGILAEGRVPGLNE